MLGFDQTYLNVLKNLNVLNEGSSIYPNSPYEWKEIDPEEKCEKKILFGMCRNCMQGDCLTLVHVEDGVVVKVEGHPGAPPNYGTLCPRGNSIIMNLYNPYRVKTPLVRTNPERGLDVDPCWKEVSWDDALKLVAKKLKEIKEEDPRGLIVNEGWGQRETSLRVPFEKAFGTPNEVGSHGALCTVHYATCLVHHNFPVSVVDLEYCEYHITLGRSLGPNFATTGGVRKFSKAIERGMKLVVVDPRCSPEASKGEWVPIRPGTDLAFLLAMAHVMFYEIQIYDEWFLKNRTNSPYLIGPDGYYIRDRENGKPVMWDVRDNCAKPFDGEFTEIALQGTYMVNDVSCTTSFDKVRNGIVSYTPEWAETVCKVPASAIRRIAREFVDHAKIGTTIQIDDFTFPFRPVSLNVERNVTNHRGGTYSDLVGKIINMLVGSIEVPGGCLGCGKRGPVLTPGPDGTSLPGYEAVPKPFKFPPDHVDMAEFYPNKHTAPHLAVKAILDPEKYYLTYQIKAWLSVGGNPIRANAQPEQYVEAFKKIPFVVSIAYHMDEPTFLADVILPEHSNLERLRVAPFWPSHQSVSNETNGLTMVSLRQPVPPVFNTKHVDDILTELAERIGILQGKGGVYDWLNRLDDYIITDEGLVLKDGYKLDLDSRYSLEEIFDRQVKGWIGEGKGLDYLNQVGYVARWLSPKRGYNYFYFPDNKTRHEFYFQHLKKTGATLKENLLKHSISFPGIDDMDYIFDLYKPVPHWVESSEYRAPEEFDLWAINWKTPYFSTDVGNVTGNPWLAEISSIDPWEAVICINSETANAKGLKRGDRVVVESRYGEIEGYLRISELFQPETIGISGCYGMGTLHSNPLNRKGPNFNSLLPLDDKSLDGVSAGQELAPRVKVYKKRV
ncbi:MAG: molybdopterin-dependent oxidoreductase [Dehalobacterium sp.]